MNMDGLNNWLTLAANIGVIAGIIFLGLEINQNTDSLQAQAAFNYHEVKTGSFRMLAENPNGLADVLQKFDAGEVLTLTEANRINWYARAILGDLEWQHSEVREGRLDFGYNYAGEWANLFTRMPKLKETYVAQRNSLHRDFVSFIDLNVLPLLEN